MKSSWPRRTKTRITFLVVNPNFFAARRYPGAMTMTRRVAPPPPAYLVLHHGDRWRDILQLSVGALTIGRGADCDVSLASESVSRRHARVIAVAVPGGSAAWAIEDLGSRHGVQIGGRRVPRRTLLAPGDRIGVGPYELIFTDSLQNLPLAADPSDFGDVVDGDAVDGGDSIEASATLDPADWQRTAPPETDVAGGWLSLAVRLGGIGEPTEAFAIWTDQLVGALPPASIGVYSWPGPEVPPQLPPPSLVHQTRGFRYRRPPPALLAMTRPPGGSAVLARQIRSSPLLASPDTAGNIDAQCVLAVPIDSPGGGSVGLLHAVTSAGERAMSRADLTTATIAAAVLGGWLSMHHGDARPSVTLAQAEAAHIDRVLRRTGGNKSRAAATLEIPRSTLGPEIGQIRD